MNKAIIISAALIIGGFSTQRVAGYGENFDCTETDSVPCLDATGPTYATCPNGNTSSVSSSAGPDMDQCACYGPGNGSCSNEDKMECDVTITVVDCSGHSNTYSNTGTVIPTECTW